MRAACLAATMAVFGLGLGCALVTDLGTSGYGPIDAGDAQAAACDGDASCAPFGLQCVAAADCSSGQVCCVALGASPTPSVACTNGSVCSGGIQLCRTGGECGGLPCVSQQCSFGGATLTLQACGRVCNP